MFPRWLTVTGIALIVVWILWLRAPSFRTPIWNVDEGIAAALADKILEGGLPYRHAIDQRPPVTYLVYAAVFAVAGANNMDAIHVALALLVAGTAVLLFLAARRASGTATAWWTLAVYATLSSCLFSPFDLYALHTEWPLSFCSAAGALLFFVAQARGGRNWWLASGGCYGAAALSKQPGLLDFGAPLVLCAFAWWRGTEEVRRQQFRNVAWLAAGFAAPVLLTLGFFAAFGALPDLLFYTWGYNTRYYVAGVPFVERLATVVVPFRLLWDFSPVLTVAGLASLLPWLYRPGADGNPRPVSERPDQLFAVVWLLGATYATTLSGRGFFHYSFQVLPPLAWTFGLLLAWVTRQATTAWRERRRWVAIPLILVLGWLAFGWARACLRYRVAFPIHIDTVEPVAAYIRAHSTREDPLFVWGFYSDLYTLADRLPASRFLYTTFPTGVIPWINEDEDT
ncbi:MAG TPA: hypothetical protein VFJ90_06660, partial [Candidatus Didemnitutus sp.]|nr:hypothetical protein [Candidatus Didemnitutus sp.]